jgi:hypothetical protein
MRYTVIILLIIAFITGCKEKDTSKGISDKGPTRVETDSAQFTTLEWQQQTIDFGKITEGQKLEVAYHFKNTGTKPLIINKVQPGCGCTVAETPKEPIAPGKEGIIKASFDSDGRVGPQHKSIFVDANTKGGQNHELVFTVEVLKR